MMGWQQGCSLVSAVSASRSKYQAGVPTTKCPGCTQNLEQSTLGWELSDGKISWHLLFPMVASSQAACEAGLPDTAVLWRWKQPLPYTSTQHVHAEATCAPVHICATEYPSLTTVPPLLCSPRSESWKRNAVCRVSSLTFCPGTWRSSGNTLGVLTCWAAAQWPCWMSPWPLASISHST